MRFGYRLTLIVTVRYRNKLFSLSRPAQTTRFISLSSIDAYSAFSSALKLPDNLHHLLEVKQGHGLVIKQGTYRSLFKQNKLLQLYIKNREFYDADNLFDEMPVRNVVTWNILIHGVVHRDGNIKHKIHLGFCYLSRILLSEVGLDHVSFIGLIRLCTDSNDVEAGIQLHGLIVKQGHDSNCFLCTTLVDFYGKSGHFVEARQVFETVSCKDLVLWNALVSSYVLNGMIDEAFRLLKLMGSQNGFTGDGFTFSSLLSGCESNQGKQIHAIVFKLAFHFDILVATALVSMYVTSCYMRDARKCFDSMVARNVVSWNAMIVGYGQNGEGREAMRLFGHMIRENLKPDELTFASVLSSCGMIDSAVTEIMQLQASVTKHGSADFLSVANSLINAYSKTGNITEALLCFRLIREPDLVSWTSVIGALAFHGFAEESLRMFGNMQCKLQPDKVTFLEILSACSHGGLVQEGLGCFKQMIEVYKIEPEAEHYACLIDLLGRAGFIDEAFHVLTSIPMEPSTDALAAFIGACNVHENTESMKWGAKKLLEMEPRKPVNYSILSNAYVSEGHWIKAALLRKTERRKCNPKTPGCSWLGD